MAKARSGKGSWVAGLGIIALTALSGCGGEALHDAPSGQGAEGGPGGTGGPAVGNVIEALTPLSSCEDIDQAIKTTAIAQMEKQLDQSFEQLKKGYGCWAEEGDYGAGAPTAGAAPGNAASGMTPSQGASKSDDRASSVSKTNNQVDGVDEADFIKNDDKYFYVAANGAFRIVEAFPAETAHTVATVQLDGEPRKLFVEGDRALVYVAVPRQTTQISGKTDAGAAPPYYARASECTYAYDCDFSGDGTATRAVLFDISDRAAPRRIREVSMSGSLLAARRIGNAVHTVLSDPEISFSGLQTMPDGVSGCQPLKESEVATVAAKFEALKQKNRAIIEGADVSALLPRLTDRVEGQGAVEASTCAGFYKAGLSDGSAFTTVVSLDLSTSEQPTKSTVVSRPGAVYASAGALYMAVRVQRSGGAWWGGFEDQDEASTVHKFRIGNDPKLTAYAASGVVRGHVLSQFAMDEHEGNLRVATTSGRVPDPKVESQITVLSQLSGKLDSIGMVGHIAPTEDIRSVRFDGARGYVVTFKKTDPLFVFDLADARAPRVLGELKIPGFSTYMHMLDETHLLTIGYDADDHGDFAYFDGVLLQIFDVTDPANPVQAHKHIIGTRGSSSEALTNHLAFNYFAPKNMLAIPMTVCEGGDDGTYGTTMSFNGLMVFDVTASSGFSEHGRVAHPNTSSGEGYDSGVCSTWWANANSEVKRSVFMDDFVYSVSMSEIRAVNLGSMGVLTSKVALK